MVSDRMSLADALAELRIARAQELEANAGEESPLSRALAVAVESVLMQDSRGLRIPLRDGYIRQAAALVPGTEHAKAKRLEDEVAALTERRDAPFGEADGVRALVRQALEIDPRSPRSWRQMLRIFTAEATETPND